MKAKTFVWAVLAAVLGVLGALALVLALTDPFFVVRGLDEEDTALFSNQRYEMAGLIRNQDYSAVVMGTSLVANYRASWFTEGLGKETLKITFPDGWLSEFDTALHLAYQTHPELDTVFFGLDLNILIRPDSQRDVELPMYLYNTNPFDDVQYFLNKETYIQVAKLLVNRLNGGTATLENAFSHHDDYVRAFTRLCFHTPPCQEDEDWVSTEMKKLPVYIAFALYNDFLFKDYTVTLPKIDIPLLLCCADSPAIPRGIEMGRHYRDLVNGNCYFHEFLNLGHVMFLEDPEQFNETILDFVENYTRA